MVGQFFNNVLPTNVGGDVIRGYELKKYTNNGVGAMASVFMERFTGLTALILLGFLSMFLRLDLVMKDIKLLFPLGVGFVGYAIGTWMVFDSNHLNYIKRKNRWKVVEKLLGKIQRIQEAIYIYKNYPKALIYTMGYSFLFYLLAVINVYVSALAFGVRVSFLDLVIIVPVILILTMFPISLGGIGLLEGAYYLTFSAIGVPGVVGISVALLTRIKAIVSGLLGGIIYLGMGGSSVKKTMEGLESE